MNQRLAPGLEVFEHIDSQTTANDKRSLLAVQGAVRGRGDFVYLEIGSHLGGSLQPFVIDPQCRKIISIDSRPPNQPDARLAQGQLYPYENNSTDRMLALLEAIPGGDLSKLETIDASTENIPVSTIADQPRLCFIDGEHTDQAALRDAVFCIEVAAPDALIAFHDAHAVRNAIGAVLRTYGGFGYQMRDSVFVIERGRPYAFENVAEHVRRPSVWRYANRFGVAGALAATGPLVGRLLRRNRISVG